MGKIVAIGGGEMPELETLPIDRRIVALTGKPGPRALFIPTASSDSPEYTEGFHRVYGQELGCTTDALLLLAENTPADEIARKIRAADLIYVGGGNTLKMMRLWRRLGVDKLLAEAYQKGTVLSGLSAGAICWFAYGHSDSMSFYAAEGEGWQYIRVRGLGLVGLTACPHLDSENRRDNFTALLSKYAQVGIGMDDNAALEIVDEQYRVITSKEGPRAYRIYRKRGAMITEVLKPAEDYRPLHELSIK